MSDLSTREVAQTLRLSPKTVARKARQMGLGTNWGGSRGRTFTEAELDTLRRAHRQPAIPARQRRSA